MADCDTVAGRLPKQKIPSFTCHSTLTIVAFGRVILVAAVIIIIIAIVLNTKHHLSTCVAVLALASGHRLSLLSQDPCRARNGLPRLPRLETMVLALAKLPTNP